MKATLTYEIPGEMHELSDALNGDAWRGVVVELDNILREQIKHGNVPSETGTLQRIRDELHAAVTNMGLDLHEPTFNGDWRAKGQRFTVDTSKGMQEAIDSLPGAIAQSHADAGAHI